MKWRRSRMVPRESGQSMMEAALIMPLLLVMVLNGLNFGYFFLVTINLATAPRAGVQYSMEGFDTTAGTLLPSAGPPSNNTTVAYLTYQDKSGALPTSASSASVQVCSKILGLNGSGTTQTGKCMTFGSASFPSPDPDPEAPWFVLNRVD